ncbi:hypothetical protein RKD49_002966 [Streptomyces glaucescens]
MPFEARVLLVMIASPSDTLDERNVIESAIRRWNSDHAYEKRTVLVPLRWEVDSRPRMGSQAQVLINKDLADRADIVVAIFRSRLGQPTGRNASGTAEEIQRGITRRIPTHVYFSEMPHAANVDSEQLKALRKFKKSMERQGLLGSYASLDGLLVQVISQLNADVKALQKVKANPLLDVRRDGFLVPILRVSGEFVEQDRERVIVENIGNGDMVNLSCRVESAGKGKVAIIEGDLTIERLEPDDSISATVGVDRTLTSSLRVFCTFRADATNSPSTFERVIQI